MPKKKRLLHLHKTPKKYGVTMSNQSHSKRKKSGDSKFDQID